MMNALFNSILSYALYAGNWITGKIINIKIML